MRNHLTAGQLLDIIVRADTAIHERPSNAAILADLRSVRDLLQQEIGGSHMGTGADVVILGEEVGDGR